VEMGIEMARRAIELDSACSYAAALQHYHQAINLLNQALQGAPPSPSIVWPLLACPAPSLIAIWSLIPFLSFLPFLCGHTNGGGGGSFRPKWREARS